MESIKHLMKQYQSLTDWYFQVLEGISDEDGSKTMNDRTNSLEWLSGHLLVGRYRNILRLGVKPAPYVALNQFINQTMPPPNAIAFDSKIKYPSLTDCRIEWKKYADIFFDALGQVDEKTLNSEIPFTVPTGGNTVKDALVFVVLHESYHIGQMSIIRKSLGYSPNVLTPRK